MIRVIEDEKKIYLKEISVSSKTFIDKLDFDKEKAKIYSLALLDIPFLGLKKALIIGSITNQQLNVIYLNIFVDKLNNYKVEIFSVDKDKKNLEVINKKLRYQAGAIRKIWIGENGNILIQTEDLQTMLFSAVFFHLKTEICFKIIINY